MEAALPGPFQSLHQRHFATRPPMLPQFAERIGAPAAGAEVGGDLGISRLSASLWEPRFATAIRRADHRPGPLHPLAIEQNCADQFQAAQLPAFANTIGPEPVSEVDKIIGGCDGTFGRGMMWQGLSVWMTLRHEPTPWIPSTYMPTQPGRLFVLQELAGPLVPECN